MKHKTHTLTEEFYKFCSSYNIDKLAHGTVKEGGQDVACSTIKIAKCTNGEDKMTISILTMLKYTSSYWVLG